MSNPVRGEQSWGARLMSWVDENLPNLLNGRERGQEGEALFALWERWEAESSAPTEPAPVAWSEPTPQHVALAPDPLELTQDETPKTE